MKRKKSIDNKSIVQSFYLGCEDPLDALSFENILQFSFLDCILTNSRRNYRGNLFIFHEHSCWKSSCNPAACERNTTTVVASFIFFLQGLQKGVISSVPFFCSKHRFVRTPAHHLHHRGCHTDWFLLSSQQYRLWHFDQSFKVPDARAYVKSSKRKEVQLVFLSPLIIHFQSNKRLCIKKKRITSDYVQLQLNKFVKPLEETRISALIPRIMWCDINNSRQMIWLNNDTNCETHWVIKVPDGKSNNFHQKLETCTKRFRFFYHSSKNCFSSSAFRFSDLIVKPSSEACITMKQDLGLSR